MKNLNALIAILIICLGYISCKNEIKTKTTNKDVTIYDTINFQDKNMSYLELGIKNSKFFNRFGVVISNYYEIIDSLPIDLNNDGFIDTLAILSPLLLNPEFNLQSPNDDFEPKRLLVEIINEDGSSKIRNIHKNLLSNGGGVNSHYNGIYSSEDGFRIDFQSGAKYAYKYSVYFSVKKFSSLELVRIIKKCSFFENEIQTKYFYNDLDLDSLVISDTLDNNCNCDYYWKILENH